jgi:hypothetical protein
MKKLFVLLMLCVAAEAKAQTKAKTKSPSKNQTKRGIINQNTGTETNTYLVVYDFAKKIYDTNFVHPRVHHPIVFKVKNINRLAYDVVITSRDSVLAVSDFPTGMEFKNSLKDTVALEAGEDPTKLPGPSIPALSKSDTNGDKKDVNTIELLESASKKSDLQNELIKYKDKLSNQSAEIVKLEKDSTFISNEIKDLTIRKDNDTAIEQFKTDSISKLKLVQESLTLKLKTLRADTLGSTAAIEKKAREIKEIVISEDAIAAYQKRFTSLNQSYLAIVREYQKMWQLYSSYNQLFVIASDPFLSYEKAVSCIKDTAYKIPSVEKIADYRTWVRFFYQSMNDFNKEYNEVIFDWSIAKYVNESGQKKLQEPFRELKKRVDQMAQIIKAKNPAPLIDKMYYIVTTLKDPSAYEMYSAPIQPSQDVVSFDVNIKERKSYLLHDAGNFNYSEFTRGGIRYDFSTGLVYSFGVADYTYRTEKAVGDSVKIIKNKSSNQYFPSIAAMFHASIRTWRLLNIGFTLGASLNTTDLDINSVFPGISLMIGRKEKIIFTAGPALKKVKYLSEKYDFNKSYLPEDLKSEVPTQSAFRIGAFVAVSYNLTKKQKSSFKIVKD